MSADGSHAHHVTDPRTGRMRSFFSALPGKRVRERECLATLGAPKGTGAAAPC